MSDLQRGPDEAADPESGDDDERRRRRRRLAMLVTPLIGLVIASNVGDAFLPTLVDRHPLVLLMLNARNRNLALVTNQLDALSYYGVGAIRLLLSDPLFFLLGRWYGDDAIVWLESRSPTYGRYMRKAEQWFGKAAYPLVFIAPNNYICLFAGAARMRVSVFLALNVSGTFFRLYLIRVLGDVFSEPINDVLDFIGRYRWYLLALTIGLVVVSSWNERRKGESEIESLAHLDDELLGDEEP